jgi:UPF0176 protein
MLIWQISALPGNHAYNVAFPFCSHTIMQANTALQAEAHAGAAQHVNIAAYKFVTFDNTEAMRPQYQDICSRLT